MIVLIFAASARKTRPFPYPEIRYNYPIIQAWALVNFAEIVLRVVAIGCNTRRNPGHFVWAGFAAAGG
jgi:hypothetical protein